MTKRSPEKLEQLKLLLDRRRVENGAPDGPVLERVQKWILHFNIEHVHGPEEVAYGKEELVVVCLVRDGRPYVRSFVEHYSSMGVKHMVFLDNGSTDGTVEALKEYDNVTVLRTTLPYKRYKGPMKQYLIERFGRGRWSLCVDIDELFDYPYSDVVGLGSLLRYLNEGSYTAVVGQMLDMFAEEPVSDAASDEDEPLKERHRFYDVSNVRVYEYSDTNVDRSDRWLYRLVRGTGNVLANEEIEIYRDGIQNTVFGNAPPLTKHPLLFLDDEIRPPIDPPTLHSVSDARVADFTCVLFHYKFLNNLYELVRQAVRQDRYGNTRYKKLSEALEKTPSLLVKRETAREIRSVNDLVENLFLVVSEEYMMLVHDEERKDADRTARGEAGRRLEDEAFHRSRTEAKVQRLRARRLKRRVEKLREQNQSRLEKLREQNQSQLEKLRERNRRRFKELREQHQRRIEKLRGILARERSKARSLEKMNRSLATQIKGIKASRSWRLMNKLSRLRARVLGQK